MKYVTAPQRVLDVAIKKFGSRIVDYKIMFVPVGRYVRSNFSIRVPCIPDSFNRYDLSKSPGIVLYINFTEMKVQYINGMLVAVGICDTHKRFFWYEGEK